LAQPAVDNPMAAPISREAARIDPRRLRIAAPVSLLIDMSCFLVAKAATI
jgi:hypothetical protein